MNAAEIYWDGLFKIVSMYADQPNSIFTSCFSITNICNEVYRYLLNKENIKPIERLPEDQKREIWNLTKGTREERIKQSKAIYLMKNIKAL